jgi:hypothetical protein
MRPVSRQEILDYVTYDEKRPALRAEVLEMKEARRVHVGDHLTLLFENTDTMRYQIQEMMRIERLVREADIVHELETYNAVLGGPGELGATLLIEIEEPEVRDVLLREWIALVEHLYARLEDGTKVYCSYDASQVGDDRLSSVQYVKFDTGGRPPVAIGSDLPALTVEHVLSKAQAAALEDDLR